MVTAWRFDENNPYADGFDESLLLALDTPEVFNVVKRKFLAIQKNPKAPFRRMIRGRMVYAALTGPGYNLDGTVIEPLVVAYTLDERKKLIQQVFVGRAVDYVDDPPGATMETISPTLRAAIARALANVKNPRKRH